MHPDTLILLGKSPLRDRLAAVRAAHPRHTVWTLNDLAPCPTERAAVAAMSSLHFEIHAAPSTPRHLLDAVRCPIITSPFVGPRDPRDERFPLELVRRTFGHAYFESTLDYMLALALLRQCTGTHWLERICLVGMEFADPEHFARRAGAHFWLGVAIGAGIQIEQAPESLLLQRALGMKPRQIEDAEPHAYGQPYEATQPLATTFHWNT